MTKGQRERTTKAIEKLKEAGALVYGLLEEESEFWSSSVLTPDKDKATRRNIDILESVNGYIDDQIAELRQIVRRV